MSYSTQDRVKGQQNSTQTQQPGTAQFVDNRSTTAAHMKQVGQMASSPQITTQRAMIDAMSASPIQQQKTIQRAAPLPLTAQLAVYKEGGKNAVAVSGTAKDTANWVKKPSVNPGGSNHIADVQARGMMGFKKGKSEHAGGKVFNNNPAPDGSRLPYAAGQTYREWDVNPCVAGVARDAERIVTSSDGSRYYTNDHYNNFTEF